MTSTVIFLTSGTSWTVPADWSATNTVECIGGGAGGGTGNGFAASGGGGGEYRKSVNLTGLSAGGTVNISVAGSAAKDTNGGDTYFNPAASSFPSSGQACGAKGASKGVPGESASGGAGGTGGYSIGTGNVGHNGGTGSSVNSDGDCGGGGGGSGGPNGVGGNGGTPNASAAVNGAPGGGGNGGGGNGATVGATTSGGNGGDNSGGTGHGVGSTSSSSPGGDGSNGGGGGGGFGVNGTGTAGGNGGAGTEFDASHGSGGGGGGAGYSTAATAGGNGASYGGGGGGGAFGGGNGGAGGAGLIVITYTPVVLSPAGVTIGSFRAYRPPQLALDLCLTRAANDLSAALPVQPETNVHRVEGQFRPYALPRAAQALHQDISADTTTLYLRLDEVPPQSEMPSGFLAAWDFTNTSFVGAAAARLDTAKGSSETSTTTASQTQAFGATKNYACAQFCSLPLAAGSYPAASWEVAFCMTCARTGSNPINSGGAIALYLINGQTGAIKTTIIALAAVGAAGAGFAERSSVGSLSGSAFAPAEGDFLLLEGGVHIVEGGSSGSNTMTASLFADGTTTLTTDQANASNGAGRIDAPFNLAFLVEAQRTPAFATNGAPIVGVFRPSVPPRMAHAMLWQATEHDQSATLPTQPETPVHQVVGAFQRFAAPRAALELALSLPSTDVAVIQPETPPHFIAGRFSLPPSRTIHAGLWQTAPEDISGPLGPQADPNVHFVAGRFMPFTPPRASAQVYQQATEHDQSTASPQPETNVHQVVGQFRAYAAPPAMRLIVHHDVEPPTVTTNPHFVAGAFRPAVPPRDTLRLYQQAAEHDASGVLPMQPDPNVHFVAGFFRPYTAPRAARIIVHTDVGQPPVAETNVHHVVGSFRSFVAPRAAIEAGLCNADIEPPIVETNVHFVAGAFRAYAVPRAAVQVSLLHTDTGEPRVAETNPHFVAGTFRAFVAPRETHQFVMMATEHDQSGALGAQTDPNVHFVAGTFRPFVARRALLLASSAQDTTAPQPETNVHFVAGRFAAYLAPRAALLGLMNATEHDQSTASPQPETNPHFVAGNFRPPRTPPALIMFPQRTEVPPQPETNVHQVVGIFRPFALPSSQRAINTPHETDTPQAETNVHFVAGAYRPYLVPRAAIIGLHQLPPEDLSTASPQPETNPTSIVGAFRPFAASRASIASAWGNVDTDTAVPQRETNPHFVAGRFVAWHVPPGAVAFPAPTDLPPIVIDGPPATIVGRFAPFRLRPGVSQILIGAAEDASVLGLQPETNPAAIVGAFRPFVPSRSWAWVANCEDWSTSAIIVKIVPAAGSVSTQLLILGSVGTTLNVAGSVMTSLSIAGSVMTQIVVAGSVMTTINVSGAENMASQANISFYRNEDITILDTLNPIVQAGIAGWTVVLTIRKAIGDPTIILQVAGSVQDPTACILKFVIPSASTLLLAARPYAYDIQRIDSGQVAVLTTGTLTVLPEVRL